MHNEWCQKSTSETKNLSAQQYPGCILDTQQSSNPYDLRKNTARSNEFTDFEKSLFKGRFTPATGQHHQMQSNPTAELL